jgi:hypothetical protein
MYSDSPRSDEEEKVNFPARVRGNSFSKAHLQQGGTSPHHNRRKSIHNESRSRFRVQMDSSSHTPSDSPQDSPVEAHQDPISLALHPPVTENSKIDTSFLNDTLQSINRLKEEKEFVLEDGVLKGGSLTAIVLRLIEDGDRNAATSFLIVLPRYGLPEQLLGLLVDKLKEHNQAWLETSDPTRERLISATLSFLALWLDNHFYRDFQTTQCLARTEGILNEVLAAGFVEWYRRCKLIILRRVGHEAKSPLFASPLGEDTKAKKGKRLSTKKRSRANSVADGEACFDTLTAADIAEQLTLREWELFRVIPDEEFLEKTWLVRPPPAHSLLAKMIDHFNVISMWVASEIVNTEDLKDRANALKKFIQVCDLLFELGNFNGLMEVVAGLSLGCVQRLHKTWSLAGSGLKSTFEKFSHIMTTKQNFQTYRHALSGTKLPAVPYVGVLLRDLIFIEEGNPLRLANGFFNFDRISLLGRLMLEIQQFKRVSYDIPVLPNVQAFFASLKALDNDDALYSASMAAENDHVDSSSTPN